MTLARYFTETWSKITESNKRVCSELPCPSERFHEICRALPEFEEIRASDNAAELRRNFGDLLIAAPDTTSFYKISDPISDNTSVARMSPIEGTNKWLLQICSASSDWETLPYLVTPEIARGILEHSGLIGKAPDLPGGSIARTRQDAPDSLAEGSADQLAPSACPARTRPASPGASVIAGASVQGKIAASAVGPARRDRARKCFGSRRPEAADSLKKLRRNDRSGASAGEKSSACANQVSCRHEAAFRPADTPALPPSTGAWVPPGRAAERGPIPSSPRGAARLPLPLQASLMHFQDEANGIHLNLAGYPALNGSNVSEIALLADADNLLRTAYGKHPRLVRALRSIIEGIGVKYPEVAGQVRHRHAAFFEADEETASRA